MIRTLIDTYVSAVTSHHRLTILVVLLVTGGLVVGLTLDSGPADGGVDEDDLGGTDVWEAATYIEENYATDDPDERPQVVDVVVRAEGDNALSREHLLAAVEYQEAVLADGHLESALADEGILSPTTFIAAQLLDEPDPSLSEQHTAIRDASDEELETAIAAAFADSDQPRVLLPMDFEAGSTESDGFRMLVHFEPDVDIGFAAQGDPDAPDAVLHEIGTSYDEPTIVTVGPHLYAELNEEFLNDALWLVLPPILLVMLSVLAFAYRDFTDVVIGFVGTVVSLLWMFGLMGWIGILSDQTAIIAPVLIVALSIDFGFHIFMRYRERREPGQAIHAALARSTSAVAVAFLLVTITAGIGFLSNLTSPVPVIRDLGIAITLGVIGALIIFTSLVPALKISADGLWERFGFDRRKTPLGKGRYLSSILTVGTRPSPRMAVIVIIGAIVLAGAGGLAFAELDREPFQQAEFDDVADWKTELPGPMAFEAHESSAVDNLVYAEAAFQPDDDTVTAGGEGMTQFLIEAEGDVATAEAMATAAALENVAADADDEVVLPHNGEVAVISPLTVMWSVAEMDEDFAETLTAADTTGNDIPDENIQELYDAFYATAPEEAATVLERTDDGNYRSMVAMVQTHGGFGSERANVMHDIADSVEAEHDLTVTAVGMATINTAETDRIADGIVQTMIVAIVVVLAVLALIYRTVRGAGLLGAITVIPIALALGYLFGIMYLVGQPLTLLTALLVSITIGLGVDYNIHVSDRFAHELERGNDVETALEEAVTGTGGALLGSAMTSGAAFALLALVPHPQFTSFGLIVAIALVLSFLMSVFLLPSLLKLWAIRIDHNRQTREESRSVSSY